MDRQLNLIIYKSNFYQIILTIRNEGLFKNIDLSESH